jgi:hypothetical protein
VSLPELLNEWEEHERDRCCRTGDRDGVWWVKVGGAHSIVSPAILSSDLGVIQAAIQEAVETRGWAWQVSNLFIRPEDEGYRSVTGAGGNATVSRLKNGIYDSTAEHVSVQADTAIVALLVAYLEALRRERAAARGAA